MCRGRGAAERRQRGVGGDAAHAHRGDRKAGPAGAWASTFALALASAPAPASALASALAFTMALALTLALAPLATLPPLAILPPLAQLPPLATLATMATLAILAPTITHPDAAGAGIGFDSAFRRRGRALVYAQQPAKWTLLIPGGDVCDDACL